MKAFLFKIAVFATAVFLIGVVVLKFHENDNHGYSPLVTKLQFLKDHPDYNLYFVGSSKINNQIDPKIIDENIKGVKTYNLGANGGFNLENYQVLDYLLENNLQPKFLVLELQEKSKLTKTNLNSERSYGMFNFKNTAFNLKFYLKERNPKQILLTLYSFVLNVLNFNKTPDEDEVKNNTNSLVAEQSGFAPLDVTQKNRTAEEPLNKEIARRLKLYSEDKTTHTPNPVLIAQLNDYAQCFNEKGTKLILLVPPPAEPDAQKLNFYTKSFSVPVINFLDPSTNPEFYRYENRWDYGHLNQKGAEILSHKVGRSLQNFLK